MTNKEKKAVLRSYRRIDGQIRAAYEQIDELMTLIKSPSFDGLPKGGAYHNQIEEIVTKKEKIFGDITRLIDKKAERLRFIRSEIERLREDENLCLTYMYLQGLTIDQTAEKMHYSRSTVCRIHGRALAHFMETAKDTKGGEA